MKRITLLIVIILFTTVCTSCDFFNRASDEVGKTVGNVKNAVDTTIKTTTDTVNTATQKVNEVTGAVGNVTNAVGDLEKSVSGLTNWQGNGNQNTHK